jgi:hypothetical protein
MVLFSPLFFSSNNKFDIFQGIQMKHVALIIPITILFFIVGCDEDDPVAPMVTPTQNKPPEILDIAAIQTSSPANRIPGGSTVQISVVAADPDGDELSFMWSADVGKFDGDSYTQAVRWIPPHNTEGDYDIKVTVTDGALIVEGYITIFVGGIEVDDYFPLVLGDVWKFSYWALRSTWYLFNSDNTDGVIEWHFDEKTDNDSSTVYTVSQIFNGIRIVTSLSGEQTIKDTTIYTDVFSSFTIIEYPDRTIQFGRLQGSQIPGYTGYFGVYDMMYSSGTFPRYLPSDSENIIGFILGGDYYAFYEKDIGIISARIRSPGHNTVLSQLDRIIIESGE